MKIITGAFMAFTTRLSLLSRIGKDDSDPAWNDFYTTYRPLILLRGSDNGLSEEEKEELVQNVMLSLYSGGKFAYDRSKGRFRSFIRCIIDSRAIDLKRRRKDQVVACDKTVMENIADSVDLSEYDSKWEQEWRRHLLAQAVEVLREQVEPVTFQAFELYALKEWAPAKVAEFLGISLNSVYVAKNRAVAKLREVINELDI